MFSLRYPDKLLEIICKHDNPLIMSSYDLVVSSFKLHHKPHSHEATPKATRVLRPRFRVIWDNHGIPLYSSMLANTLASLLESLGDPSSPEKVSSLLSLTNQAILSAAKCSFKVIKLSKPPKPGKPKVDPTVRHLSKQISQITVQIRKTSDATTKSELAKKRSSLSHAYTSDIRKANLCTYRECDTRSNQILSSNPSTFHQYARSLRPPNPAIDKLESGGYVFQSEEVADGFFFFCNQAFPISLSNLQYHHLHLPTRASHS